MAEFEAHGRRGRGRSGTKGRSPGLPPARRPWLAALAGKARGFKNDRRGAGLPPQKPSRGPYRGIFRPKMLADGRRPSGRDCGPFPKRRADPLAKTDALVRQEGRPRRAWRRGVLVAIVCIGERTQDHPRIVPGQDSADLRRVQLAGFAPGHGATSANTVVAYEPVWAIGHRCEPRPRQMSNKFHGFYP